LNAGNNSNVQKVEVDAIMRAAGNILSTSVKTIVEERFEKDKHDKEKDKHDKEKDKHERRMSRETERSERESSIKGSRASLLSDPLARLGTSAVTEFIPKHQYPVKSWYFPPDLTYLDLRYGL
jgi:predicted phage gp36 major capsid-like protein